MTSDQAASVFAAGAVLGVLVTSVGWWALVFRPLRRERDEWRRKAERLLGALLPFVSIRARYSSRTGRWAWRCRWHNLLGGRFGDVEGGSAAVHDEAREHFAEEHLTPATFARARAAAETMGEWA